MTVLYMIYYRSPITGDVHGDVFEDLDSATMVAVATESTYNCKVKMRKMEVEI